MSVTEITSSTEFDHIIKSKFVLVDFHAHWCGPCRAMAPVVEKLAETNAKTLSVCSVDIDKNQDIAKKFRVTSLPTFMLFYNGTAVKKIVGADPVALEKAVVELCNK